MIDAIAKRRSVRQYRATPLPEDVLEEILWAGLFAPSSADRRPVHYIVIRDRDLRRALGKVTRWSAFAAHAPCVVAVCGIGEGEKGKRWVEDCSIAATHLMLEATAHGIGSCWIQIKDADPPLAGVHPEETVKKLLKIPPSIRVLCLITLGYPTRPPIPHTREDVADEFTTRIHKETFGSPSP